MVRDILCPPGAPRFQYFKLKSATFSLLFRAIFAKVDPQTGGPGGWPQGAGIVLLSAPPYANLRIFQHEVKTQRYRGNVFLGTPPHFRRAVPLGTWWYYCFYSMYDIPEIG